MLTLKDYVNWGLTHCDKTGDAEGVPLVMEKCVKNKRMKQLEVYGNCVQNGTPTPENPVEVESIGELVTDVNDANYGKYKVPVVVNGEIFTNIYLNEPLRKIGDYGDVLDFKNKKATRVIQRKVLDGSEVYISMQVQPHPYVFVVLGNYGTVKDDICLCNQLQYQSNFSYTREGINTFRVLNSTSGGYTARCGFRIYENGEPITELEAVQALIAQKYTAGNPIVLYYALTTPYEETIECELPVLMAKTSIVEIDTTVLPSNMKGEYIKK